MRTGCVLWKGARNSKGYGVVSYKGTLHLTHRLSYTEAHPEEDIGDKVILHMCDNRACINPEHLTSGTSMDNTQDMIRKGRMKHYSGEENGFAKLTWNAVHDIRRTHAEEKCIKRLCDRYGVAKTTIRNIVNNKSWRTQR